MFHTRLWETFDRDGHRYSCHLADVGAHGVEVRIARDGIQLTMWRFSTGEEALAWAAEKRTEIEKGSG